MAEAETRAILQTYAFMPATMSLRLDSLGKSMGSAVMRMKVHVEDGEI